MKNNKLSVTFVITLILLISLTAQAFASTYIFNPIIIDGSVEIESDTSMTIVNGYPAVSYSIPGYLMFIRANDVNGTSWGTPQLIASIHPQSDISMAIVDGRPAIAFYENEHLRFIRANDENGNSWPDDPIQATAYNSALFSLSLAVVNGYPAISYYDDINSDLVYVRATSTDGSTWGTPITVDSDGSVGRYNTLLVVAGNPAIGYHSTSATELRFIRANDANGTSWPITGQIVNTDGDAGHYASMALVNGNPAFSYVNNSSRRLKFIRANDAIGSDWPTTTYTLDTANTYMEYTSLALINGKPAISYFNDGAADSFRVIIATNADGTVWNSPIELEDSINIGKYSSIKEVNGLAGISYVDDYNNNLKFVQVDSVALEVYDGAQQLNNYQNIDLGTTTVGNPITRTLTIVNNGISTLDITRLTLPSSSYSMVGEFIDEIPSGGSVDINIRLDAMQTHSIVQRTLQLRSNDTNLSPFSINFYGEVTEPHGEIAVFDGATEIVDGTGSFDFGSTTVGTSVSHTFTVENTSTEDLNLYSLNLPAGFSLQGTYDYIVAPGATTDITVRLDAILVGTYSGDFSLANDDADENPFNFTISGEVLDTSGEIAMFDGLNGIADGETTPIDFGTTALGTPVSRTFTIQNLGSNALDIYALTLPSGFSLQGTYNHVVAPSSSTTITVQLDASFVGSYAGEFSLANDDTDENPFNFAISGQVNNTSLETGIIAPLNGSTILDSSIQVAFNHDVLHDGSAEAADNPVNYLLVEDGANGLFETNTCLAGVAGDDVQQTITGVTYDASTFIASINTDPLPAGHYQLLVCGTASIEDLTGNVLNAGAFDSVTAFTVVSANTGGDSALTALLPATGFTPGTQTSLPTQPAHLAYNEMDSLTLQIPSLKVNVPIVGVPQTSNGWDVTWLTNAQAGWLNGTAYPTWDGNTVLTGHVTNASGNPGPFANIKTLKFGDQITIQAYGETYTYQVRENKLVSSDDMSIIEEHKSRDWVTLITCEYFNENTGQYLFRRVIRAVLVEVE